jgi:hypothetical protein
MSMIPIRTMFMAIVINRVLLHVSLALMGFTILRIRAIEKLRHRGRRRKQDRLGDIWGKTRAQRTLWQRSNEAIWIDRRRRIRSG